MSLETMTKLATYTVGAGGDSSVTFSNIPQTYTDLVIRVSARTTRSASTLNILYVTFNGVTTNQTARVVYGDASGLASTTDTNIWGLVAATDACTANTFGNSELTIPNYTSANYKSMFSDGLSENVGATAYTVLSAGLWSSTAAITSISFASSTSNTLKQYSTFTLYGVKAMRQSMSQTARAIGGTITRSGGYTYHTFTSSDMFVPTGTISSAEILAIGGGGGSGRGPSGGGGAGGVLYFPGQSFTSPTTVIVGGGGAGVAGVAVGNNGTNSQVGSLTAALGGGYGGAYQVTYPNPSYAGTGGSGGGAGGSNGITNPGGTGTTGQGNNGGAGTTSGGTSTGGGGGGAGGAGSAGTDGGLGGAGGVGTSTYSAWGLATSTGENVSSTYYYAGGGGGASAGNGTVTLSAAGGYGGGGRGGRGGTGATVGGAGLATTGGGAGGSHQNTDGVAGGSGVVIIRYAG